MKSAILDQMQTDQQSNSSSVKNRQFSNSNLKDQQFSNSQTSEQLSNSQTSGLSSHQINTSAITNEAFSQTVRSTEKITVQEERAKPAETRTRVEAILKTSVKSESPSSVKHIQTVSYWHVQGRAMRKICQRAQF